MNGHGIGQDLPTVEELLEELPIPEELLLREGQNVILNDRIDVAFGQKGTLTYEISGVLGQRYVNTYWNGDFRNPVSKEQIPGAALRILRIQLFKTMADGGRGLSVDLVMQGEPYVQEVLGTGQLAAMFAAKEKIAANTTLEIEVENVSPDTNYEVSITLFGEMRETGEVRK